LGSDDEATHASKDCSSPDLTFNRLSHLRAINLALRVAFKVDIILFGSTGLTVFLFLVTYRLMGVLTAYVYSTTSPNRNFLLFGRDSCEALASALFEADSTGIHTVAVPPSGRDLPFSLDFGDLPRDVSAFFDRGVLSVVGELPITVAASPTCANLHSCPYRHVPPSLEKRHGGG